MEVMWEFFMQTFNLVALAFCYSKVDKKIRPPLDVLQPYRYNTISGGPV